MGGNTFVSILCIPVEVSGKETYGQIQFTMMFNGASLKAWILER